MFIVIKRKTVAIIVVTVLIAATLAASVYFVTTSGAVSASSARKVPVYAVETEEQTIALTFDAAWGADKTEGILKILRENEVKATFFLVGFWVDKFPELVKKIAAEGHDIGNHSENHLNMSGLGKDKQRAEIEGVNEAIEQLTGIRPVYFRAPFGDYSDSLMTTVEELSMVEVQWSIDTLDWKGLSAAEIERRVLPNVKGGDIILMHNNSDHVLEALPLLLIGLKAKGIIPVKMSSLVLTDSFQTDNNGIQRKLQ